MKKAKVIIIVAPSGTGKSTLLKMIFKEFPQLMWSISTTTRSIREGEINGKDYHFVSEEEFKQGIKQKQFIEWAEVHGHYYGTSHQSIADALKNDEIVVCDLDTVGTDNMLKSFSSNIYAIFIEPPSLEALEKRLIKRGTDSAEVIDLRLRNAKRELGRKNDYHFNVKNISLDQAFEDLKKIFMSLIHSDGEEF